MGELRLEQGVTVDFCAQCRAVWFDPGELAAMVGTREDLPALDAVADGAVGSRAQCPRCNGASLTEMRYAPDASPRVATCALCRGVMASLPDLPALKAAAAGLRRMDTALAAPYRDAGLARAGELDAAARRFNGLTGLAVKQRRRWLEMLTGWETPNEYAILRKGAGGAAFHVVEQTAGVLEIVRRLMLGPMRPFTSHVEDISRGTLALRLVRPWRWLFPELQVLDADERPLVLIRRRWSWVSARYDVDDAHGRTIGELRGAFWRPWTFELHGEGRLMAVIKKRWSGLFTEAFSDADNYSVDFEPDAPDRWKLVALAAAVLIDVVHFESSKR